MKSVYFYNNRRVPASKQKRKLDHSHSFGRSYEHSNSVFPTFHSIQEVLYLNFVFRCRSLQTGSLSLLRSPRTWRNSHCRGRKLTSTSEIRTTDRKTENKEHHSLAERRKKKQRNYFMITSDILNLTEACLMKCLVHEAFSVLLSWCWRKLEKCTFELHGMCFAFSHPINYASLKVHSKNVCKTKCLAFSEIPWNHLNSNNWFLISWKQA